MSARAGFNHVLSNSTEAQDRFNMIFSSLKSDHEGLNELARKLGLPNHLCEAKEHNLEWLSQVHEHFESVLRERVG